MKNRFDFLKKLSDKTTKLSKVDYIIIGIMILIYGIISFYRLGDTKSPATYYTFNDIDEEVVINLNKETYISSIRYWTGSNIGNLEIMISSDGKEFHSYKNMTTYSVLSWEDTDINAVLSSIKFVSKGYGVTLGDTILYDNNGVIVNQMDKSSPLLDEIDLVPTDKSYMNSLYFDEIYHARCAYEYVNGINCFEWSHPPLGKLIMAIPVAIFGYSPLAVRLMGNLAGILLIPVMYILCKKIFKNRKYALLGALLMMFDNMHFAHTRIALVDGFEVLFILLSVLFMVNYISYKKNDEFKKKAINLLLSGLFIGCAIATKWNALYVGMGLAITFFIHLAKEYNFNIIKFIKKININSLLKNLFIFILLPTSFYFLLILLINKSFAWHTFTTYLLILLGFIVFKIIYFIYQDKYLMKTFIVCVIGFIFIPIIIYILSYILFPNLSYYDGTLSGILDINKMMYEYHSNLDATHPFSSTWYEWPIMYRPVWFYSGYITQGARMSIVDIGNPAIWWFSIISFIYVIIGSIKKNSSNLLILIFILSSFVPYIFIGRIMFMYHYFITLPFMMLAIVSFIKWITEKYKSDKVYWLYIGIVIIMFWVFYPVVSGMNISDEYINSLKWFSSWIF